MAAAARTLAVTATQALERECAETQRLVHAGGADPRPAVALEQAQGASLDLCELDALRDELRALLGRAASESLSEQEREYAGELAAAVVDALAAAYTSGVGTLSARADGPAEARRWLLELAVHPSPVARRLAFSLLLDVCIAATSIAVTSCGSKVIEDHYITVLQDELFTSLKEMLAKAVVVASATSNAQTQNKSKPGNSAYAEISWVRAATECLVLMTRVIDTPNTFRQDRLGQLDGAALRYCIETAAMCTSSAADLQLNLIRLLLASVSASTSDKPQNLDGCADISYDRSLGISSAAFQQCCSLEILLVVLYSTPCADVQRMLFRVLFDLACEQLTKSKTAAVTSCKDPDLLWESLIEQDFISRCVQTPLLFSSPAIPHIAKSLATVYPSLYDKSTLAMLLQLQRLLHIEDYFDRSSGLANITQVATCQGKSGFSGKLLQKVDELLASTNAADKFRGELWLAELLVFGNTGKTITNVSAATEREKESGNVAKRHHLDTSDVVDLDESNEIRSAAQSRVWELAAAGDADSPGEGQSFARIVTLFIRRLIRPKVR